MSEKSNSERFLIAFAAIEGEMNRRIKSDRYISYSELVRRMSILDRNYHRFQRYLEEFGDLRNAIVHERIDGEVIAEPHLKVVQSIEHIAELLTQPERVSQSYLTKVDYCLESDSLKSVLHKLLPKHYSKLPVYDSKMVFKGLITTDLIYVYLVNNIKLIHGEIPEVTIHSILEQDEKNRLVEFIPAHSTLLSVVTHFERSLALGKRLNALIITQDGASNQKPLGIISISDLPKIYDKINKDLR